ncbi:hypothetical protein PSHT_06893 [Puccinia striiformis]|uniref:Uncharacterized protein n=1 Tax=Puccinia striiformis TaxID=27350 RepID=A0A2S4W2H6_9BASI|nr:hypothetical protein PSHT_06893 [Puccinia striiformis]
MPAPTKPPTNGKHNDPEQLMPHAQLPLRNPGLEKPTGAAKRSYVSTTGSSSSAKAEVPGTCNTARTSATEARELVDVKPSLHQARTTKTARCPPAVSNAVKADQRPAVSASLSSIKFKKNAPPANQNENGTTKSGLTSLLPANQNKDGAVSKNEAESKVENRAIQIKHDKKESETKNDKELVQISREQSIIWEKAAEADRVGDKEAATALYKRFRELDSTRIRPKRPSPEAQPGTTVQEVIRPTIESTISFEKTTDPEKTLPPFFDNKMKTLRSPLPLTIFNPRWQKEALAYELKRRALDHDEVNSIEVENEGLFYYGYPYPDEILQDVCSWTRNHRYFHATLRDVYKFKTFAEWMSQHKANADQILEDHGFMVALRYDIHVRANVFNHRVIVGGKECVADVSVLREDIKKEAYNRSSEFKELGYQDNPYLRGEARFDFSPHTGERERQDHRVSQIHDQKATDENRFRKSTAHENQDKVVRNPRYFGNSYIPNFVYERNRNNNYRVAGGSASNV